MIRIFGCIRRRRLLKSIFLLLGLSFGFMGLTHAQIKQDSDSTQKHRKFPAIFLPVAAYSPETRIFVGLVGLSAFSLGDKQDTRTSNAYARFEYSQNKQMTCEVVTSLFTGHDRYFLNGVLAYRKFPEYWWGIGNAVPDGNKERYEAKRVDFDLNCYRKISHGWYLGGIYTLRTMFDLQPIPDGVLDSSNVLGKQGGASSGVGIGALHDNRDNLLNPSRGTFLELRGQVFNRFCGSDFKFSRFTADLRTYVRISKNNILAIQGKIGLEGGQPPFRMLMLVGGINDMRGYYQGRYRDRDYFYMQAEYRAHIFWRLGVAGFVGFGDVGHNFRDIGSSIYKYTVGGGLRVLVNRAENINIRFDYALGYHSKAFYVGFGEAF